MTYQLIQDDNPVDSFNKLQDFMLTPMRSKILEMELLGKSLPFVELKDANKVELAQANLAVKHYFSLGVYARELYIPAGSIVVGKLHKHENLNILTKGLIEVLVDDKIKLLKAPAVIVSPAGTKRIARALEDTIWITVHGTHETDVSKIEDYFIAQSEDEYLEFINKQPELPLEPKDRLFRLPTPLED